MKKMIYLMFILGILFLNGILVSANGEHGNEIAEGKRLVESKVSCDKLTDEQFEEIGEYLMEQMHPGESHDAMHKMRGIEEGTESHEQFHVNIAKMMYCGNGMMGSGGMMGMMPMMMGGGNMMNSGGVMNMMRGQGIQSDMMQGMVGNWGYYGYWNFLNILYIILLIGLIILVYLWILKLWKNMEGRGGKK